MKLTILRLDFSVPEIYWSLVDVVFCLKLFDACGREYLLRIGSSSQRELHFLEGILKVALGRVDSGQSVVNQPIVAIFLGRLTKEIEGLILLPLGLKRCSIVIKLPPRGAD